MESLSKQSTKYSRDVVPGTSMVAEKYDNNPENEWLLGLQ
jgi:hypothetical protein